MRLVLVVLMLVGGCRSVDGPSGQGGAGFRASDPSAPVVPVERLFEVCWPATAAPSERIALSTAGADVVFEAKGGASNSTGWCVREIATSIPGRPFTGALEVGPPKEPPELWAVLAWVKLLSPSRYGPEKGLLDPASLAAACVESGRPGAGVVAVEHAPLLVVRGFRQLDAERCLEAVLASTAWPSPRELRMRLGTPAPRDVVPAGDVAHYFAPPGEARGTLEAQTVRDTLRAQGAKVSACWNEALTRRAGLGGGRTFRFRTDEAGQVTAAWISTTLSDAPPAVDAILDRCLAEVLRGVRFPGTSGDGVYTWVFASRG